MAAPRTALVTGASRGIGRAVALQLANDDYHVAGCFASPSEAAAKTETEVRALDMPCYFAVCDVRDGAAVEEFIVTAERKLGPLTALVNNAGIVRDNLILRMKEEDWDAVLDTNLKGAWNFSRAALRFMLRQEEGGAILNISSISGVVGMAGQSNYSASKAGMIGLTKALAREVASRNVAVNALALGLVVTDMSGALNESYREKLIEQIPMKRFAEPDEVARIACFMVSESARYITGQVIQVDGGLAM